MDSLNYFIDTHCRVLDSHFVFRVTRNGTSYKAEKGAIWRRMYTKFYPSTTPWICEGDFNEYLWAWEKSGGADLRHNRV